MKIELSLNLYFYLLNLHIFNMLALYLADLLIISDLSSVYIKLFVFFFFFTILERIDFFRNSSIMYKFSYTRKEG